MPENGGGRSRCEDQPAVGGHIVTAALALVPVLQGQQSAALQAERAKAALTRAGRLRAAMASRSFCSSVSKKSVGRSSGRSGREA